MIDFIDYSNPFNTIISKSTIVNANINASNSVEVKGKVIGNIETINLLSIYGSVVGNVESKDLILRSNGKLNGNVELQFDGIIDINSKLEGNISCKNIEILGTIEGDIISNGSVIIRKSANIIGDITCQNLVVDEGAIINGNVKLVYQLIK